MKQPKFTLRGWPYYLNGQGTQMDVFTSVWAKYSGNDFTEPHRSFRLVRRGRHHNLKNV